MLYVIQAKQIHAVKSHCSAVLGGEAMTWDSERQRGSSGMFMFLFFFFLKCRNRVCLFVKIYQTMYL